MKKKTIWASVVAGAAVTVLSACLMPVGDGVGLDEAGNRLPDVPPDTNLTFVYQQVISTSACTGCHQGTNPDGQLDLSSINAMRAALVTINGTDTTWKLTTRLQNEAPRYRVLPEAIDSSLLYKIVAVDNPKGDYPRMPRNMAALNANKITVIRRWIELGASLK